MATVIIGGGIIGTATAYYLSKANLNPSSVHIVESAPRLFASASGYAGGFLAKDWFSASVASLGALSFDLHKELAHEYNGQTRWGYAPSTALSLAIDAGRGMGSGIGGEDWLLDGTSRAGVSAAGHKGDLLWEDGTPAWVTRQTGGTTKTISTENGCAQVEPRQLCEFLMEKCQERGVCLHMPARATQIVRAQDGTMSAIVVDNSETQKSTTILCERIIFTTGAWTPSAFRQLFPDSTLEIPISSLAGHSIIVRSPQHTLVHQETYGRCHAVFAAPSSGWSFAPEAFSRQGGEIYVAGLNSESMPLPRVATETTVDPKSIDELKEATAKLVLQGAPDGQGSYNSDLEVTREALCFRPIARGGRPIIARVEDKLLEGRIKMPKAGGVYIAAGHGPWGISLSLGTGKVVAEMVQGVQTSARVDGLGMR